MRLLVHSDGAVMVTVPWYLRRSIAEQFIKEKSGWLFSKINFFEKHQENPIVRYSRSDYASHKEKAHTLAKEKADYFSRLYGHPYHTISIKNQRTCWGSCSRKGNLNFNYKILFLPENMQDYIVVHEICHLKELSHSKNFWQLVAKTTPDYAVLRKALKQIHL